MPVDVIKGFLIQKSLREVCDSKECLKLEIANRKELLKELPFYDYKGSLVMFYGKFNNSLVDKHAHQPTKYELENLPSLHDVNLFDVNTINTKLDSDLSPFKNLLNNQIQSRYFSPYGFCQTKSKCLTPA